MLYLSFPILFNILDRKFFTFYIDNIYMKFLIDVECKK